MCSFLSLFSSSSKVPMLAVTATAINILCIKAIYLHTAQYLCSSLHSLSWSRNSTHFTEPSPLPLTQHTTFRFSYDSICIFHLNHSGFMPCLSHPHWPANPTNSTSTARIMFPRCVIVFVAVTMQREHSPTALFYYKQMKSNFYKSYMFWPARSSSGL